jgi:hypothetical protein
MKKWERHRQAEAWPDEALERGLARPFAKRGKNWGRARFFTQLTQVGDYGKSEISFLCPH